MTEEEKDVKLVISEETEVARRAPNGDLYCLKYQIAARNIAAFVAWLREAYPEAF